MNWNGFHRCLERTTMLLSQTAARIESNLSARQASMTQLRSSQNRLQKSKELLARLARREPS